MTGAVYLRLSTACTAGKTACGTGPRRGASCGQLGPSSECACKNSRDSRRSSSKRRVQDAARRGRSACIPEYLWGRLRWVVLVPAVHVDERTTLSQLTPVSAGGNWLSRCRGRAGASRNTEQERHTGKGCTGRGLLFGGLLTPGRLAGCLNVSAIGLRAV